LGLRIQTKIRKCLRNIPIIEEVAVNPDESNSSQIPITRSESLANIKLQEDFSTSIVDSNKNEDIEE